MRDIANTNSDEDYDDDYAIARYSTVSFVIDGYAYIATGYRSGVTADYWKYDPDQDLWYGDSDDDFTPLTTCTITIREPLHATERYRSRTENGALY